MWFECVVSPHKVSRSVDDAAEVNAGAGHVSRHGVVRWPCWQAHLVSIYNNKNALVCNVTTLLSVLVVFLLLLLLFSHLPGDTPSLWHWQHVYFNTSRDLPKFRTLTRIFKKNARANREEDAHALSLSLSLAVRN